jgi:hypothetical protein
MADGAEFAVKLMDAARKYYGAVGREWLGYLVVDRDAYAELLREYILKFEQAYMPKGANSMRNGGSNSWGGNLPSRMARPSWRSTEGT